MIGLVLVAASFFTAADIPGIRRTCHAPASWFRVRRDGTIQLAPPKNHPDYKKADCILQAMHDLAVQRGAPEMNFVGNEAPEKPE